MDHRIETLSDWFRRLSAAAAGAPALRHKRRGVWATWSWDALRSAAEDFSGALQRLDVPRGSVVSVMSENRPEWLAADFGTQLAHGVTHGVHPTWSAPDAVHALELARSEVLLVENAMQMRKLEGRIDAGAFRRVVFLDERDVSGFADCNVVSWQAFLAFGAEYRREHRPPLYERGNDAVRAAWMVESTGEDGPPSLGTISHAAALERIAQAAAIATPKRKESMLSFAPLADPAERALVYAALSAGAVVHLAEQPATVLNDLQEVQPHWVHAPARFWEKQASRIEAAALLAPSWARRALRFALARPAPQGLSRVVARNVRRRLGLARARIALAGGASMSPDVQRWYAAIGVRIDEAFVPPGEERSMREAERELRASCAIADALVFEKVAGRRVALLRPERDFVLACAQERQLPFTSFDGLMASADMLALLRAEVERANAKLAEPDRVRDFRVIPADLPPDDAAVSAALRLRRDVIARRHSALLGEMTAPDDEAAKAAGRVAASVLRDLRSKVSSEVTR